MKTLYSFLAVSFILITISACSKYEFGPDVSLRTKKGRLANDWELVDIVKNRMDTLGIMNTEMELTFDRDYNVASTITYKNTSIGDSIVEFEGEWTFDNDGIDLIIIQTDSAGQKDANLYEILLLSKDELWLSEISGTDEYIYYFEEQQ